MSESKQQSAAKAITLLTIISFSSQALGFLREMLQASFFGTSHEMDAYNMAYGLMLMLPIILVSYINSTYIPEYSLVRSESEEEAARFYSLVLTIGLIISICIAVAGHILAPELAGLFAPGFTGEVKALTIKILRFLVWLIPAQVAMNVCLSTLHAKKTHIVPNLISATMNIFIIAAALLFASRYGIWAIVVSLFANTAFQIVCLVLYMSRQGYRYRPSIDIKNPRLYKTIRLAVPSVAASSMMMINELVDKTISSSLPAGSVSAYTYAVRLVAFIPGLVFGSFLMVFLPRMSDRAANNDKQGALDILWRTVETLLAVALPVCAITMFMRAEIVRIVFERGAFGQESTMQVGIVLMFFIWLIVIYAVSEPIRNTFIAWQDMRGIVLRGVISVAVNAVSSILLSRHFGIIGVVLGTLLGSGVYALTMLMALRRRWGALGLLRTVIEGIKMLLCTVICGFLARSLRDLLPASDGTIIMDAFRFVVVSVICLAVFYGLALAMRTRGIREVFSLVAGKIRSVIGHIKSV